MFSRFTSVLVAILVPFLFIACKKNKHSLPCDHNYAWAGIFTDSGCANGKIVLKNFKGKIYMPSLNRWGDSSIQGLRAGKYPVILYLSEGCKKDTQITIEPIIPGPHFLAVLPVLQRFCGTCHSGNNPHAGIDLTDSCTVVRIKDRIYQRALLGLPTPMPSTGLIPLSDRQIIERWMAMGGRWTD